MKLARLMLVLLGVLATDVSASEPTIDRIAFGSCNSNQLEQPLWPVIQAQLPDLWVWTGDMVYGNPATLEDEFRRLKSTPGYRQLAATTRVVGVWDDHDYGLGQGGIGFPHKEASRRTVLEFLDEPPASPRWTQPGIYASYRFGPPQRRIKLVLLDVRFNRQAPGPTADILGDAQWHWLDQELGADDVPLTLIVSGTQVLSGEHRWDKWADYPQSKERLLRLVRRTPGRTLFISGDRHVGELTRSTDGGAELFDITASGMTHSWADFPGEPNPGRVGQVFTGLHFGMLRIDWPNAEMHVELIDQAGQVVLAQAFPLDQPLFD